MRGFEYVPAKYRKNKTEETFVLEDYDSDFNDGETVTLDVYPEFPLPSRATFQSAGYDFASPVDAVIAPNESVLIWTDVRCKMLPDEVLELYPKSGLSTVYGIVLKNTVGIIDSDYYKNESTGGNIGICLKNTSDRVVYIKGGDYVVQGIFKKYYTTNTDEPRTVKRKGGFGSTGKSQDSQDSLDVEV